MPKTGGECRRDREVGLTPSDEDSVPRREALGMAHETSYQIKRLGGLPKSVEISPIKKIKDLGSLIRKCVDAVGR